MPSKHLVNKINELLEKHQLSEGINNLGVSAIRSLVFYKPSREFEKQDVTCLAQLIQDLRKEFDGIIMANTQVTQDNVESNIILLHKIITVLECVHIPELAKIMVAVTLQLLEVSLKNTKEVKHFAWLAIIVLNTINYIDKTVIVITENEKEHKQDNFSSLTQMVQPFIVRFFSHFKAANVELESAKKKVQNDRVYLESIHKTQPVVIDLSALVSGYIMLLPEFIRLKFMLAQINMPNIKKNFTAEDYREVMMVKFVIELKGVCIDYQRTAQFLPSNFIRQSVDNAKTKLFAANNTLKHVDSAILWFYSRYHKFQLDKLSYASSILNLNKAKYSIYASDPAKRIINISFDEEQNIIISYTSCNNVALELQQVRKFIVDYLEVSTHCERLIGIAVSSSRAEASAASNLLYQCVVDAHEVIAWAKSFLYTFKTEDFVVINNSFSGYFLIEKTAYIAEKYLVIASLLSDSTVLDESALMTTKLFKSSLAKLLAALNARLAAIKSLSAKKQQASKKAYSNLCESILAAETRSKIVNAKKQTTNLLAAQSRNTASTTVPVIKEELMPVDTKSGDTIGYSLENIQYLYESGLYRDCFSACITLGIYATKNKDVKLQVKLSIIKGDVMYALARARNNTQHTFDKALNFYRQAVSLCNSELKVSTFDRQFFELWRDMARMLMKQPVPNQLLNTVIDVGQLPLALENFIKKLFDKDKDVLFVGGFVRDSLRKCKKVNEDYDLAVTVDLETLPIIFKQEIARCEIRVQLVHSAVDIAVIQISDIEVQILCLGNEKPGQQLEEILRQNFLIRDFYLNGVFWNIKTNKILMFDKKCLSDIYGGNISLIRNDTAIDDDPRIIIRAARLFSREEDYVLSPRLQLQLKSKAGQLKNLKIGQFYTEMTKLFLEQNLKKLFSVLEENDILMKLFPKSIMEVFINDNAVKTTFFAIQKQLEQYMMAKEYKPLIYLGYLLVVYIQQNKNKPNFTSTLDTLLKEHAKRLPAFAAKTLRYICSVQLPQDKIFLPTWTVPAQAILVSKFIDKVIQGKQLKQTKPDLMQQSQGGGQNMTL